MKTITSIFVLATLAFVPLPAQYTTQQITGFVRDASGAVVPNSKVSARQQETGVSREATANETGYYIIPNVPIGMYDITVEAEGFKRVTQTGIKVDVNAKPQVDIVLEVGSLAESVQVTADRADVETNTGEVGRLVTGEQATKLQLNGRNFAQLLFLLPGVSSTTRSSFGLFGGFGSNMSGQSINGSRNYTFSWNVDGADNKDNGGGGNNFVNVNPDAIAEFKVLTSNYSAEYGQNSGAVVNLALKSGTKAFHGALYEYVRNDAFDARAWNATTKQKLRFNNFGGNLGGPIYVPRLFNRDREKLFFFFSAEYKRLRQQNVNVWNVPNLAQRAGDFSALPQAQWPRDPATGQVFPGGVVPANRFSPNGKKLVDLYPSPNFTGTGGNFLFLAPNPLDSNQYIAKVDYNLNERHQIAVHYLHDFYTSLQNTSNFVLYNRDIPGLNTSAKWTFVPSPTAVNTLQFTFTGNVIRQGNFAPNPTFTTDYSRAAYGINYPMIYANERAVPQLRVAGFNNLDVQPRNWNNFNRVFQLKDDYSRVVGNHTIKAGILAMRSRKNQDNQPDINGTFTFASGHALSTGNGLADALLGNFNSYSESSSGREGWFRFTQIEMYGADNWRVSQRLTLDLGLRWTLMQPQYAALQNAVVFAPSFYDLARAPQIDRSNGQIVPGTGDLVNGLVAGGEGLPKFAAERIPNANDPDVRRIFRGLPKEISPWRNANFGPRIGFAYDLTGRTQTVVRGGYGLFFERVQGNFVFGRVNNPPFIQSSTVFSANVENPRGGSARPVPPSVDSYEIGVDIPKVQNWSLGIQHKLLSDTVLDVAYVGSSGWNQYRRININQLPAGTLQSNPGVNVNALRPYPGYANINQFITGSNFIYNSMQVQLRKQFSGSGILNVSYTWAKAITDATNYDELPQDSYNFKAERALSANDRRHVFVASYVYPLPFWRVPRRWYEQVLGGWELSGVTTLQTGRPLNITIPGDAAGIGVTGQQRPDVIGDPYAEARQPRRWFNPAAFVQAPAGRFGNLGRNAIEGPGQSIWDVSAHKIFTITERVQTEFRAEVYNFPHHFSYWDVASTVGANNFGQVTSATDPRTLQFGLRLRF